MKNKIILEQYGRLIGRIGFQFLFQPVGFVKAIKSFVNKYYKNNIKYGLTNVLLYKICDLIHFDIDDGYGVLICKESNKKHDTDFPLSFKDLLNKIKKYLNGSLPTYNNQYNNVIDSSFDISQLKLFALIDSVYYDSLTEESKNDLINFCKKLAFCMYTEITYMTANYIDEILSYRIPPDRIKIIISFNETTKGCFATIKEFASAQNVIDAIKKCIQQQDDNSNGANIERILDIPIEDKNESYNMRNKYSKEQLLEAISFWEKQLKRLNEQLDDETQYDVDVQNANDIEQEAKDSAIEYAYYETVRGQQITDKHAYKWLEVGDFYKHQPDGDFYLIPAEYENWFIQNIVKNRKIVVNKYLDELIRPNFNSSNPTDFDTFNDVIQEVYFDDYPPPEEPPVA